MADIPKAYEPGAVEARWYQYWLDQGCFTADPQRVSERRPAYSIVIPPPNVTGVLHMGHVLNNTIQDILARKARMDGREVLWLPGTDHAGIATQAVVERTLRQQGVMKHRDDLGRDRFLEHVWQWKEKHGGIIIQQLKKLGCSCDWTRERFTMDAAYSRCVQKVFVELYRKGLIYRGRRMVNWDPAARTALSDEEVEMVEESSHLWHIQYPLLDGEGRPRPGEHLVVATTRPETMLGDEAVAVNPRDARYQSVVGGRCLLPLRNKPIPIIADDLVDPEFGTGCVKVTPAHDPADYDMAMRHGLPVTIVIGPDGSMTREAGEGYAGLDRKEARRRVVEALQAEGLQLKVEPYVHHVGYSQRSHVAIEPYLSEQWFLRYPSAAASASAVEEGRIRFHPDRWVKTYTHWMQNLRDWCISRQLWWGHRIPVWYRREALAARARMGSAGAEWDPADIHCDVNPPADPENWEQDSDVLDTWFSSWLWPFATMGWPEESGLLRAFYPTSDLVTGPDIIFFWVARMIMAGEEFMGEAPFRNVYFTGIIRDKLGRKMSKSLGNSPDPLELIARYGADALRFGAMRSAPLGQDVLFDEKDVELGRNFCNKLWNVCRFRQMQGGELEGEIDPGLLTGDDRWILRRLDAAIREVDAAFAGYRFNEATQTLYRFFWGEFCDWHIESSKAALYGADAALKANSLAVIDFVLSHVLRLFHPFLPHITEELWQGMGFSRDLPEGQGGRTIMTARWPRGFDGEFQTHYRLDDAIEQRVQARNDLVVQGRNLRREGNLAANRKVRFVFKPADAWSEHELAALRLLLNADPLEMDGGYIPPKGTPAARSALGELYLPLEGLINIDAERGRLQKTLEKIDSEIARIESKLQNAAFVAKAPPAVLEEQRKRLAEWQGKRQQSLAALEHLGS